MALYMLRELDVKGSQSHMHTHQVEWMKKTRRALRDHRGEINREPGRVRIIMVE